MNNFSEKYNRSTPNNVAQISDAINTTILPFEETPATDKADKVEGKRLDAHELFSLYTANVINDEIIYAR